VKEFNNADSLLSTHSYIGSFEFEGNSLNLVQHGSGFIKNLKSMEYQTGTQNGNIQGSSIVSIQKIGEGKYEAENQICLLPGFESKPNDKFSAEIKSQNPQYQWQYALSDHLGNLRVLFTDKNNDGLIAQSENDSINEVLSIRNYSPFGLELGGSHKNLDYQNGYKFGGKELNNFTGLTDFGRRNFDAPLARFTTQDRFSEKYYGMSTMGYAAGNPVKFIDVNGDSLDVSGLSIDQLEKFNSQIALLKESKLFLAYYNTLSESKVIYKISAQKGKEGTPSEMGQFFNSRTNEVGFGEKLDAYIIAQELFHAFQKDGEFYKNDFPSPLSTIETEGDILTQYVMVDAGLAFPIYGDWSNGFQKDSFEGIPSIEKVVSPQFQKMFQDAVDNRIKYYKNSGINAPTYTSPNTGIKPKAFESIIRKMK
jgi:RHS repeat-associated protein